ncbi:MAG: nitronate monooxygenase, partial [Bacillota bacterium]
KEAILKAKDRDTVLTGLPGHEVRVLKNKLTREFVGLTKRGASLSEFEELGRGRLRAAAIEGDIEMGSLMAGQISALVRREEPVANIIQDMLRGAEAVLDSFQI